MRSQLRRARSRVQSERALYAVFAIGVVLRALLIPLSHGQDFIVWDKASTATLHGLNIYQQHPDYPHGPFAYFPLFVYLEVPFQWLAQHTALTFTLLGKVPVFLADLACAIIIASELKRRGCTRQTTVVGTSLFFLNPLVLYNSAFYGRFDTVACALLPLAYYGWRMDRKVSYRRAICYGLAVAAKTFPSFVFAGLLRHAPSSRRRIVITSVGVILVISAPYLATPYSLGHDILFRDAGKAPTGLSWQHLLLGVVGDHVAKIISYALLALFVVLAIWLTKVERIELYTALTLVLFIVLSKVVLEQYLVWPMAWLVLIGSEGSSRISKSSLSLAVIFTATGMLANESFHPFGRSPWLLNLALAAACIAYLVIGVAEMRATTVVRREIDRTAVDVK